MESSDCARRVLLAVVLVTASPRTLADDRGAYQALWSGGKLPNTGYTRVNVSPSGVQVECFPTHLPADEGPGRRSGDVAFGYAVR